LLLLSISDDASGLDGSLSLNEAFWNNACKVLEPVLSFSIIALCAETLLAVPPFASSLDLSFSNIEIELFLRQLTTKSLHCPNGVHFPEKLLFNIGASRPVFRADVSSPSPALLSSSSLRWRKGDDGREGGLMSPLARSIEAARAIFPPDNIDSNLSF
jgi:hypothetical protein